MGLAEASELQKQGRLDDAEAECRRELRARPFDPGPCHMLGTILHQRGQLPEATELMRRAVAMAPSAAKLRVNLGALLGQSGKLGEAVDQFLHAVKLGGNIPELHGNLGVAFEKLGRMSEAVAAYRTAVYLKPDYVEARLNLGNALRQVGDVSAALGEYREALRLRPQFARAYGGLADAAADLGDAEEAVALYRRRVDAEPGSAAGHSALLYTMHYSSGLTPLQLREEARQWAARHAQFPSDRAAPHDNEKNSERRLRIGYLSPDFRAHTLAHFAEPLLEAHDRKQFEVRCYSAVLFPDQVTRRLGKLPDAWVDISRLSDADAARRIRADRVDILVDLAGHMGDHRLLVLARRPAPVQVQIYYAGTTGLPQIDYRITDAQSDPPAADAFYTERLVRLPDCPWLYKPSDPSPAVGPLPALSAGHVTFGCLNKLVKVTDVAIALWCRILLAVPGSRLLLLGPQENAQLTARFALHGISADRLEVAGHCPRDGYLELFNRIDIALDPFPYNGDTTTCDGFWMGVPLVALAGEAFVSRRGVSHLTNVGLGELVAQTPEQYMQIAIALAGDLERLSGLRATLRQRLLRSPLCDAPRYAAHLEAAYRRMWREWCAAKRGN